MPASAPGVVLIMTDTTRWDMLGCYRDTGIATPQLDRLAAGGMRFERAYTCTPVCGPARSALFTGTWPHGNGSWANSLPLGTTSRTVGELVSDQGVHAAYVGKWHLDGTDYFGSGRCPNGWDERYWYDGRRHLEELTEDERRLSRQGSANGTVPSEFTYAHRCTDRAIRFLEEHSLQERASESFFLVVSYDEPHGPSISPQPFDQAYADHTFPASPNLADPLDDKPDHQRVWAGDRPPRDPATARINRPQFFGSQTYVDSQIGRVLDAIDRLCPGAVVIYTSDHGDALGSHRLDGKGPALYDEIARIPFLIRWPGVVGPGTVHRPPASHIDVTPTVLDALGVPVPPVVEGRSLVPLLRASGGTGDPDDPSTRPEAYVFSEFGRYEVDHDGFGGFQPLRGVVDERYKLVVNLLSGDELYDLETDPDELTNLIDSAAHARERDRLHDRLLAWMHETRDPFRGYHWERRPWRTDAPAATWAGRGMTRQREEDGLLPRELDYDTGLPMDRAVRPK